MEKIKRYIKIIILSISVFIIWHLIVTKLFMVSDYDDLSIPYTLAGTILTIYLYGKRK